MSRGLPAIRRSEVRRLRIAFGASDAAGDLIGREDDGGSEEGAALAEKSGVVVGGTEAGEEVEAEGSNFFLKPREIERDASATFHRCPMRSFGRIHDLFQAHCVVLRRSLEKSG